MGPLSCPFGVTTLIAFMTELPLGPSYLLKALPANSTSLGIRHQQPDFGGGLETFSSSHINIHSVTLLSRSVSLLCLHTRKCGGTHLKNLLLTSEVSGSFSTKFLSDCMHFPS